MSSDKSTLDEEKLIFIQSVKQKRVEVFLRLDREYWLAKNGGGDTSGIVRMKQELRDAPQLAKQATSINELRKLWPALCGESPFAAD